jgi:hypothetical protein
MACKISVGEGVTVQAALDAASEQAITTYGA